MMYGRRICKAIYVFTLYRARCYSHTPLLVFVYKYYTFYSILIILCKHTRARRQEVILFKPKAHALGYDLSPLQGFGRFANRPYDGIILTDKSSFIFFTLTNSTTVPGCIHPESIPGVPCFLQRDRQCRLLPAGPSDGRHGYNRLQTYAG